MKPYIEYSAIAAVLFVAAFLLFNNLGEKPLELYDEGTYAIVVQESFDRGDFLTFTLGGQIFFDKPPLYFWLAGVATYLTGDAALGIRLPAALTGLGVVLLTICVAAYITRRLWVGALAGALLIATPLFITGAREARLDVLLSFFALLAILFYLRKQYVWFGVAFALAILSKSVIAVLIPVFIFFYALFGRDWQFFSDKKFWWGIIFCLVVVLPWHVYETALFGWAFWESYIGTHVFGRYEHNLFGDPNLQQNYIAGLFDFAKLLTGLFLLSCVLIPLYWYELSHRLRVFFGSLLVSTLLMFGIFFTAQTRAISYLLPLYPCAAVTISLGALGLHSRFSGAVQQ